MTELMSSNCLGFTQIIRVFFFSFNSRHLADTLGYLDKWVKLIKFTAKYENLALGRLKNNKMPHKHVNHPNFTMYVSLKRLQLN